MSTELYWLVATIAIVSILWIPYILQYILQAGIVKALMDGSGIHPNEAEWAQRAKRAHYNAVENLVVFAPLIIIIHITNTGDNLTAMTAEIFFYSRLVYQLCYLFGVSLLRTLSYAVGFGCQAVLIGRLLGFL